MIQISEYIFQADEGKVIVHNETLQRFGSAICLGVLDNINNYFEDDIKEEDLYIPDDTDDNENIGE